MPATEDRIIWTGADKRPSVGSQTGEPFPGSSVGKRKNQKNSVKVERVEVAASGDMAWEFSYGKLEFDVGETPLRHMTVDQGILRVSKKVDGQWKTAAVFVRPLDTDFAPPGK